MRNHLDLDMLPRKLVRQIAKEFGVQSIEVVKVYNAFWQEFETVLVKNKKNLTTKEPETLYIPHFGALVIKRRILKYHRHANFKKLQRSIAKIQPDSDDGEPV